MPFHQQMRAESARPHPLWRWASLRNGIYIFGYHSIYDPGSAADWEHVYTKIATHIDHFAAHVDWLRRHMNLISQSEAMALSAGQIRGDRYAVIHFDDAYTSLQRMTSAHDVRPTVFVNGDFALGKAVYYRVLAAVLVAEGHSDALRESLRGHKLPESGLDVFDALKNYYRAGVTEEAVKMAWAATDHAAEIPAAHLNVSQLKSLADAGWEIGNHTSSHYNLADLSLAEHDAQIGDHQARLLDVGLPARTWLAYPNGLARHVGQHTAAWMEQHSDYHGFFMGGAVNREVQRAQWRRIAVGDWSLQNFVKQVRRESAKWV